MIRRPWLGVSSIPVRTICLSGPECGSAAQAQAGDGGLRRAGGGACTRRASAVFEVTALPRSGLCLGWGTSTRSGARSARTSASSWPIESRPSWATLATLTPGVRWTVARGLSSWSEPPAFSDDVREALLVLMTDTEAVARRSLPHGCREQRRPSRPRRCHGRLAGRRGPPSPARRRTRARPPRRRTVRERGRPPFPSAAPHSTRVRTQRGVAMRTAPRRPLTPRRGPPVAAEPMPLTQAPGFGRLGAGPGPRTPYGTGWRRR